MSKYHLLYENFLSIIERRNTNIGLHWRGDAEIQVPQKIGNCPYPLRIFFKDIHNQYLQWNCESVFGAMSFPDVNIFDTPLQNITLDILGEKRKGNLYEWLEDLSSDSGAGDYPLLKTYIFVDDSDKNFCHLIIKYDSCFVPTVFGIDDFLLLYAHTRGIDGLYYMLANGCSSDFLYDKLFRLPFIFENIDLDFCVEKLYQQYINRVKKEKFEVKNNVKIELKNGNFLIYINDISFILETKKSFALELLQNIISGLSYAHDKDKTNKDWQMQSSIGGEEEDFIFLVKHFEKDLIGLENITLSNPAKITSDLCNAISFYTEFLRCIKEFINNENDLKTKNEWLFEYNKLKIMLKFLYLGYFDE